MRAMLSMLTLLLAAATLSAQQSPFAGRWNLKGTGPEGQSWYYWMEITQKDGQLQGTFLDRTAHSLPFYSVKVEGNELVLQKGAGEGTLEDPSRPCGLILRARLEGGKLIGHHTLPAPPCAPNPNRGRGAGARGGEAGRGEGRGADAAAGARGARDGGGGREGGGRAAAAAPAAPATPPKPFTVNWVGTRQPVWPHSNANGYHTYGKPVVVVGPGVGIETWTGFSQGNWQTPCENRWTFENGTMKNAVPGPGERPTCNVYTKERMRDFKVEAELNLDQGQNSGFYIRGRYELQLSVGGNIGGATAGRQSLGAIYGWKAADFYAAKPPGEWQSLEAIVVGNRISVWMNGVRIHSNAELPAMTGGALDNDELQPGPIMIQGDHSRVTLRKLVMTPITRAGQ
jgi:hypothetical protein